MYNPRANGLALTGTRTKTGSTYTLAATDAQKLMIFTSTSIIQLVVPQNTLTAPTCIELLLAGTRAIQVLPGSGVTINSPSGYTYIKGQYSKARLIQTTTNTWILNGLNTPVMSTSGLMAGGSQQANVWTSVMLRLAFSTGVATIYSAILSQDRKGLAGTSDCVTYGYFAGGSTGAAVTTADRVTYSTGVAAVNTASRITTVRTGVTGLSDGATYGYFCGGGSVSTVTVTKTDRIVFSTGVTAVTGSLQQTRAWAAGVSDKSNGVGYVAGGETGSGFTPINKVDVLTYSTSTFAASTSTLSTARISPGALSDNSTYGYFAGGDINGYPDVSSVVVTTDRVDFSNGIFTYNASSNLSQARAYLVGVSDGVSYGYFCGGTTVAGAGDIVVTTDRITFSTGSTAAYTTSNLAVSTQSMAAINDYFSV